MLTHISRERFERIRSQQYGLGTRSSASHAGAQQGDNSYHLLEGEYAACKQCGTEFQSVDANTPAELEAIKYSVQQYIDESGATHTLWEDENSAHAQIDFTM